MKALILDKVLKLTTNLPLPKPDKDEALIKVSLAGVCNTDKEIIKGYMKYKGVLGHEFVGVVEKCRDKSFLGKRVVGEININCGRCAFCRKGLKKHCPERSVLGILNRNGAFAEYLTLPISNLHIIPKSLSHEEAVFTEPLAACYESLEQVKIKKSDRVVVLGDGKMAILMAQVIKSIGPNPSVIGKHKNKLQILRRLGIKNLILKQDIKSLSLSQNFDLVFECTGCPEGLEMAFCLIKPRGKIILKSTYAKTSGINLAPLVINEITVIGSRCGPFRKAIRGLQSGKINVKPLITEIYPLDKGIKALNKAGQKGVLKVLIRP